jgi:DNA polymerase-3 subunit alpha
MRDVLRRYKPNRVEDLTALNALYRPGPMAMIDDFIERKWGRRAVEYDLPEMETILRETLGVMVYQEQVMQIANVDRRLLAGRSRPAAPRDGQEGRARWQKQRERFMAGAAENKHPKEIAGKIFDLMAQFAGYGFNKSHSAAYALLAYHTAWLKTHYPVEFMAALLTSETSKPENVVKYISECREMNIPVVPPDVQVSDANFTPVRDRGGRGDRLRPGGDQERRAQCDRLDSLRRARRCGGREAGFRQPVGVLREGRSAAAEQARAGVADQGRRDGCFRAPRAGDGRAG